MIKKSKPSIYIFLGPHTHTPKKTKHFVQPVFRHTQSSARSLDFFIVTCAPQAQYGAVTLVVEGNMVQSASIRLQDWTDYSLAHASIK